MSTLSARRLAAFEAHKKSVAVTPLAHAISPAQKLALIDHARSLRKQCRLNSRCIDLLGVLLEAIDGRTGAAWRKVTTLARELDCSVSTVQRTCRRLERADLVRIEHIRMRAGDHGASRYWPNWAAIGRDLAVAEAPREKAVVARQVADEIATTPAQRRSVLDRSETRPKARPAVTPRGRKCDHHLSLGIEIQDPVGNTIQGSGNTETLRRASERLPAPSHSAAQVAKGNQESPTRESLARMVGIIFALSAAHAFGLVDFALERHGPAAAARRLWQARAMRVHPALLASFLRAPQAAIDRARSDARAWRSPPIERFDLVRLLAPWASSIERRPLTDGEAADACRRWAARLGPAGAARLRGRLSEVWTHPRRGWAEAGWLAMMRELEPQG